MKKDSYLKHTDIKKIFDDYNIYIFRIKHRETLNANYDFDKFYRHIKMIESLIDNVDKSLKPFLIDVYINKIPPNKLYYSASTYYYKRCQLDNILWKYIFD